MTQNDCKCGRPTRDAAYSCDHCGDQLARALGDVPWLDEQLEVTITRQQGIDYRRLGGGKGGRVAPRSGKRIEGDRTREPVADDAPSLGAAIQHDSLNWTASEARTHLRALLVLWARLCFEEDVRSSDPRDGLPDDNLPAISRWLLWRVDGLLLHEAGWDAVDEITSAVAHCHRLIDKHPERQYLGPCSACTEGRLYARPGGKLAVCESCDTSADAEQVRTRLLEELDDRLCTAAEIARLSTYLGLRSGRDQVRNRINQWHARGRISSESMFEDQPAFKFGTVYAMLVGNEYGKVSA